MSMMSLANAIIYGEPFQVEQLLKQGFNPNEIDEYGFRPLIEAAIADKKDMAELLLHYGAQVDQEDSTGRTALHWAVENNNVLLAALLLEHGADVNHYTKTGQSVLVNAILRNNTKLKNVLYYYKADLNFALDYINTKLIGHRFDLVSKADIVDPAGKFVEIDFEGFFLEFTINIILQSLMRYRNNFAARTMRKYFKYVQLLIQAFQTAAKLIRYQQYLTNLENPAVKKQIELLLNQELLIIPVAHRGHAITFVRYGNLLAKCDRGENSLTQGSVVIYRSATKKLLTPDFFKQLLYIKQSPEFIQSGFKELLDLEEIIRLPLSSQISGNCSWANVEAAIPAILFLLLSQETDNAPEAIRQNMTDALLFYEKWEEWDKDRALYECLKSIEESSRARKASKAGVLGAVLFQCCYYHSVAYLERAEKIVPILIDPEYRYILDSYIEIYWKRSKTLPGKNLVELLETCGISWY